RRQAKARASSLASLVENEAGVERQIFSDILGRGVLRRQADEARAKGKIAEIDAIWAGVELSVEKLPGHCDLPLPRSCRRRRPERFRARMRSATYGSIACGATDPISGRGLTTGGTHLPAAIRRTSMAGGAEPARDSSASAMAGYLK